MKKQNNQHRQTLLPAAIAVIFLLGAFSSTFAQKKGAITEQEIKDYFVHWWTHDCAPEDDCSVAFDSAVRVAPAIRHTFGDGSTYLTYPVKVDFTTHKNGGYEHLAHYTRGVYYFYRNSFDDWEMGKENEEIKAEKDEHQDGGTAKAPTNDKQPKPDGKAAKNDQPAANNADRDENGMPKPDFSAMEKWFEVVRYEYDPIDRKVHIHYKAKVESNSRPETFKMEFRDKDGMMLQDTTLSWIVFSGAPAGELTEAHVSTPGEAMMKKVATVKVVRIVQ